MACTADRPTRTTRTLAGGPARRRLLVGAVAALLAAAGCSSGSDTATTSGSGSTTAPTPAGTGPTEAANQPVAAAPRPSPGCGTSTAVAGDLQRHTVDVAGTERWFLLTTPAKHDGRTPVPLVVDLHGLSEGAEIHAKHSELSPVANEHGFVAAFPQGTGQPVRWDQRIDVQPNPDIAFFDALLAKLGGELCLDTGRVYVTGLSYGAIMTSSLLCTRANVIAAAAPVDGIQFPAGCAPARRVPILAFHGTVDPILRFNGGVGNIPGITGGVEPGAPTTTAPPVDLDGPGYPANVKRWAEQNGCTPKPEDRRPAKGQHSGEDVGSDTLVHRVYDCPDGADVEFYIIVGGGHTWPGSEFSKAGARIMGPTTSRLHASEEAWAFFTRFALP